MHAMKAGPLIRPRFEPRAAMHADSLGTNQAMRSRLLGHVVWLRGVDWALPRQVVQERILEALEPTGHAVQHAEAPGFTAGRRQKKHQHHQVANTASPAGDHKGYALVSFASHSAAQAAMPVLQALPLASDGRVVIASLAPSGVLPPSFPEHARYTTEEWESRTKREEYLVGRRVKMKRYRERKREQHVEGLGSMLSVIPPPGGMRAMEAYQPFMPGIGLETQPGVGQHQAPSSAELFERGSEGCHAPAAALRGRTAPAAPAATPAALAAAAGAEAAEVASGLPIQAGARHVIDWSLLPEACQVTVRSMSRCDTSGSESEGESSDGQQPRVPLRVQRKRAQVESFARALWMLLVDPGSNTALRTPSHASTTTTNTTTSTTPLHPSDQDSTIDTERNGGQALHALGTEGDSSSRSPARDAEHATVHTSDGQSARPWEVHVVEFGCGSGNLVLPLACLFPELHFHAVDYKAESVALLRDRAAAAGLGNLTTSVGRIEEYSGPMDVALALHACGAATDYAMLQAQRARAAYIVSPCCIGKLQNLPGTSMQELVHALIDMPGAVHGVHGDVVQAGMQGAVPAAGMDQSAAASIASLLTHPRSRWLHTLLPPPAAQSFQRLAIAADISHGQDHGHEELARLAKAHVELDRNQAMHEQGYKTCLTRLLRPELHMYKADLLLGVPEESLGTRFRWSWQ